MKKFALLFVAAAMIFGTAIQAHAEYTGPKLKFRVAHTTPPGNHITLAFDKFAELVEQKSGGKIKVQVFPNAILGSDRVVMENAQRGSIEMAVASTPNMANFSPIFQVFDLPYITSPEYQENFYKAIDAGPLHEYFDNLSRSIGLEPIVWAEYGYRNFCTVKEAKNASDLAGIKVRTTDSQVEVEVAKALKMNPTPVAWGEVYTALQQNTVDGEGNTFPHLFGAKHNEVLKFCMDSAHNYSMQLMMANKKWWDKLEPVTQELIMQAAQEAIDYQRKELYPADEKKAREGFIKSGIVITDLTPEQKAEFAKLTAPIWDQFKDQIPQELVKLVQDTQK